MSAWPASLPQQFEQDGYQEAFPEATVRTEMDVGPPKVRRRYTAAVRVFAGTMYLTPAQAAELETFYVTTTAYGSIAFEWTHPRTGAALSLRFLEPPQITADQGKYRAAIRLEALP